MELILNLTKNTATQAIQWYPHLILIFLGLITISFLFRSKFNKDWQQILWSYFGVLLLAVAMATGWIC